MKSQAEMQREHEVGFSTERLNGKRNDEDFKIR
jgi:hypothetical protein